MAPKKEPDGKNSLIGEFLLALARAPAPIQESILMYGLKQLQKQPDQLVEPYPMISHMCEILSKRGDSHHDDLEDDDLNKAS